MQRRAEQALAKGHTEENPRALLLATGQSRLATLVRGSSRRITTMRLRPANIRVINRRDSRLGHFRSCVLLIQQKEGQKEGIE